MKFLAGIGDAEENASIVPAGKRQAAKTQPDFAGLWRRDACVTARGRQGDDLRRARTRPIEERFRFAMRHEPGIQISRTARIDFFERFERQDRARKVRRRSLGSSAARRCATGAAGTLRKNHAKRCNGSSPTRVARSRSSQSRAKVRLLSAVSADSPSGTASTAT